MMGLGEGSTMLFSMGPQGSPCQPNERRAGSIDVGDELQDLGLSDLGQQVRLLHPALATHPASGRQERLDQPLVVVAGCVEQRR